MDTAIQVLGAGRGEFRQPDPDGFRAFVREHKVRSLTSKVMTEQEAVSRFVRDGDYVAYDCNMARRGPTSLMREIIRQRRRDLWIAAKFTSNDVDLLVAGGCVSKVDVGWMQISRPLTEAVADGRVQLFEWTNGALAYRLLAGAMGVPFLPLRYVGGTDVFRNSGAKLIEDPYTGEAVCLVPALNPDVAVLHAHQCDEYGNARIYGPGIAPQETAAAAKRLIISTEEIIDSDEIRRDPHKTMIPYYMVDAVVEAPFGCYPGAMPGVYAADLEHVAEFGRAMATGEADAYLEEYVFSVGSHMEMLEERVGAGRLLQLRSEWKDREGYR
jgi:acyl CoA:acetate/3-ketoacid CoA transferase alpha subunit